jgi:glycosyltransferase involved in cell wall biosynthesis
VRILQLHNHHAGPGGGAKEVLVHEAEILSGAGHTVEQYTLPATEELGLSALRAGAKAVHNREAARQAAGLIRAFGPDVVHVHTPFPLMSPSVFRPAHSAGIATVATLHSFRYSCVAGTCLRDGHVCEDCVGSRVKLPGVIHACYHDSVAASAALTLGLGLHRALGTFDRITRFLTMTAFARDLMVRDGYPAARIRVKPNSVPDPGYRALPTGTVRRVAFVGRFEPAKGVRTLLEAWTKVGPGLELVVAGDGTLRAEVERLAAADSSVRYLGWLQEPQVAELLGSCEAVIVSSEWYEAGTPLVAVRSLGVGTPVIVSDLENLSAELLADGAGWAFATGDPSSLAARLRELAAGRGEALAKRPRARGSYESRFSPRANLTALESVYEDACRSMSDPPAQRRRVPSRHLPSRGGIA